MLSFRDSSDGRTAVTTAVAAAELLCKVDELGDSSRSLGSVPILHTGGTFAFTFGRYPKIA
jgi:hypothetical protein